MENSTKNLIENSLFQYLGSPPPPYCAFLFIFEGFFSYLRPNAGHGLPILKVSRSQTTQSVGLLCSSDQPDEQTSTLQHTTLTR
jgi:hypothetical protein